MTAERRVIRVTGHVQGVSYRQGTRRQAHRLDLHGFVRNEPDGSVTVDVEGEPDALDQLIGWCRIGPANATVDDVVVETADPVGHDGFRIR